MSVTQEIIDESELAKSYITNSNMSDDYKKVYLKLINISTLATNGISPEEKIQKMTEAIQLLAVTQGMYMVNMDERINEIVKKENQKKCDDCKALKHAIKAEEEERDRRIIDQYRKKLGLKDGGVYDKHGNFISIDGKKAEEMKWSDILKTILTKPYIYILGCLMTISPYGVEIIKAFFSFYVKN